MKDKPIVVTDTGVVLQSALNANGPAGQIIEELEAGRFILFLCPALRSEIEDVLLRPTLRIRYPQLTPILIENVLSVVDNNAVYVPNPPQHIKLPRDAKDEVVINLAIEVKADYLVARDRDLLDLASDVDFCTVYSNLQILDPVRFLDDLRTEK